MKGISGEGNKPFYSKFKKKFGAIQVNKRHSAINVRYNILGADIISGRFLIWNFRIKFFQNIFYFYSESFVSVSSKGSQNLRIFG